MVMSTIQGVNYANMKATISKIFVSVSVNTSVSSAASSSASSAAIQIKSEPLFIENKIPSEGDTLYVGMGRAPRAGRGRGWRGFVLCSRGRQ